MPKLSTASMPLAKFTASVALALNPRVVQGSRLHPRLGAGVQIKRFQQVGDSWTKCNQRVQVPDTCSLPVFSEGLDVTWHRFRFRAGVIHLGPTPHTGHYRSILKPSAGQTLFITDDGVPAAKVTRAQEDMIRANLYLCFFTPDN